MSSKARHRRSAQANDFKEYVKQCDDNMLSLAAYYHELGRTFEAVSSFETAVSSMITTAMHRLPNEQKAIRRAGIITRMIWYKDQTVGQLYGLLRDAGLNAEDAATLKWYVDLRNDYVHSPFDKFIPWASEVEISSLYRTIRRLRALQIVFARASERIMLFVERAGWVRLERFSEGTLVFPSGLDDLLKEQLAASAERVRARRSTPESS